MKQHTTILAYLISFLLLFTLLPLQAAEKALRQAQGPIFGSLTPEEKAFLTEHPVIRVSNETDWPPFDFAVGDQPRGFSVDLLNMIAERIGITIEYVSGYTWDELEEMFRQKQLDIVHPVYHTKYREKFGLYTASFFESKNVFIIHKESREISDYRQLNGKIMATPRNYAQENYIRRYHPEMNQLIVENIEDALQAVEDKKADATVELDAVARYFLKRHPFPDLKISGWFREFDDSSPRTLHYLVRDDWPLLRRIMNKALMMITPGELRRLEVKWLGESKVRTVPRLHLSREERDFIRDHPVIRISNETDWPPFDFAVGNQPQGFSIDLLKLVTERIGIKPEFVNGYTWHELVKLFRAREIDVLHPLYKTPEREKHGIFTTPIYNGKVKFIVQRDSPEIEDIRALYGKTVAIPKGFAFEEYVRQNHPQVGILTVKNSREAFDAVDQGRAYATLETDAVARYFIRKNLFAELKLSGWFREYDKGSPKALYFSVRKDWPILHQLFEKALQTITLDDIRKLEKKWLGESMEEIKIRLTQEEHTYLQQRGPITICADPDQMPFGKIAENGMYEGMGGDFMRIISERIRKKIILIPTAAWSESVAFAKQRKCDILFPTVETRARKKYMNFTEPVISFPIVVATRDYELFIKGIGQIADKKLAAVKEQAFLETFKNRYPDTDLIEVNNMEEGLQKIRSKEVYGFLGSSATISFNIQKSGMSDIKIAGKTDMDQDLCIAVRNDDPMLFSIFQKTVQSLTEEERQKIYNKWISVRFESGFDYSVVWKIVAAAILLLIGVFYWNRRLSIMNREIRKANTEKSKFLAKMDEAMEKIMDSIRYAERIQRSLLPNPGEVKTYLPDSFFLWMPRDIVGGDVYFTEQFRDGIIIAVIDCTGHGVPGAFMTMIASSFIRRITTSVKCHDPAEILKRLNAVIKASLQQDRQDSLSDDGMDAAVCFIEVRGEGREVRGEKSAGPLPAPRLIFAGAKLPLFYVHNREVTIIRGDRQSIGYKRSDPDFDFTNHTIPIKKGMCFYMSTDGFWDQLGGERGRSFSKKRFRSLLKEIADLPFEEQQEILVQSFEEYKGANERQDDVTVVGFGF